jgi:hypothetical protein
MTRIAAVAMILFVSAAQGDDKQVKIVPADLDVPTSRSEHARWLHSLRDRIEGKQVTVTGTLFGIQGEARKCQVLLFGKDGIEDDNESSRVFIKMERDEDKLHLPVTVTGKARIETGPVQVWIDDAHVHFLSVPSPAPPQGRPSAPQIQRIKPGSRPPAKPPVNPPA